MSNEVKELLSLVTYHMNIIATGFCHEFPSVTRKGDTDDWTYTNVQIYYDEQNVICLETITFSRIEPDDQVKVTFHKTIKDALESALSMYPELIHSKAQSPA